MENLINIKVSTVPNGYILTVDKKEYMLYSLEALFDALMYHAGLQESGYVTSEDMKNFLGAAAIWRADDGKTSKEMLRLLTENESLHKTIDHLKKQVNRYKRKANAAGGRGKQVDYIDDEDEEEEEDI